MASLVSSALDTLRSLVGSVAWGPMVDTSRSIILSVLRRIEVGQLTVKDKDGSEIVCGRGVCGSPHTELRVVRDAFWLRMALFADMGFAESYMLGEVECPDLTSFFRLFILNRDYLSNATTLSSSISNAISGVLRKTNTLSNALLNISAHYDISNEMFAAFLSSDMTYSCPIWRLQDTESKSDKEEALEEALEEAQMRKLDRFIDNAHIKQTDHVLEIGTGWGSFAIRAVQRTGCRITSLTLSREQKELADKKIADHGLTDHIEILLCDYRALPLPREGPYDKVVSIEMLEAVGREFLATYFECVHKLLKPNGGIAVFQCITMPEARYEGYSKGEDFIRKYIFPGGHLPTVTQLVKCIEEGSKGLLVIDQIENIGPHYAKTLRIWNENFMANFDSRIKPALIAEHVGMTDKDAELFRRKWEYYFTYCEAGFNTKTLGDVIISVSREGAMEMLEGIPL